MTPRRVLPRLKDMLSAIEEIKEYTAGFDYGRFQREKLTFRAVERALEIISEASRHIPAELTERHPDIPGPTCAGSRTSCGTSISASRRSSSGRRRQKPFRHCGSRSRS
jgi:uncharacterized protein with HEPN domain